MCKFYSIIHEEPEGGYSAEVPALPGCFSDGDTFDEAVANIREAAAGWLAAQDEQVAIEHSDAVRVAL